MIVVDAWQDDMVYFYHDNCYYGDGSNTTEEDPIDYFDVFCHGCGREIVADA